MKICSKCGTEKEDNYFAKHRLQCKDCFKKIKAECNKKYDLNNKEKISIRRNRYKTNNKERIALSNHNYYINNKNKCLKSHNRTHNKTYHSNPLFKLRKRCSNMVRDYIKGSKNGSIIKYLPYTIYELKEHLEKQFESWITWQNWGKYDPKTWDDNNSATWTWQLDHIVPHSTFQYISMQDDNFKKCWALDNLRPYSAKQNIKDGTSRIRHY